MDLCFTHYLKPQIVFAWNPLELLLNLTQQFIEQLGEIFKDEGKFEVVDFFAQFHFPSWLLGGSATNMKCTTAASQNTTSFSPLSPIASAAFWKSEDKVLFPARPIPIDHALHLMFLGEMKVDEAFVISHSALAGRLKEKPELCAVPSQTAKVVQDALVTLVHILKKRHEIELQFRNVFENPDDLELVANFCVSKLEGLLSDFKASSGRKEPPTPFETVPVNSQSHRLVLLDKISKWIMYVRGLYPEIPSIHNLYREALRNQEKESGLISSSTVLIVPAEFVIVDSHRVVTAATLPFSFVDIGVLLDPPTYKYPFEKHGDESVGPGHFPILERCADGKPFGAILKSAQEDGIKSLLLKVKQNGSELHLVIDLKDNHCSGLSFPQPLPCKIQEVSHKVSVAQVRNESPSQQPFLRFVLLAVNPDGLGQERLHKCKMTFKESAQTLANLFSIENEYQRTVKPPSLNAMSSSKLLYSVSSEFLRITSFPALKHLSETYWSKFLTTTPEERTSSPEGEIKGILFDMLTESNHAVAVVSSQAIGLAWELLERLRHLPQRISFESSNIDTIKGNLQRLKTLSGVAFVLVRVTGVVSPTELSSVISLVDGSSVRLIVEESPIILRSLKLTNSMDCAMISKFLRGNAAERLSRRYDELTKIGQVTLAVAATSVSSPEYSAALEAMTLSLKNLIEKNRKQSDWRKITEECMLSPIPSFYFLVCRDSLILKTLSERLSAGARVYDSHGNLSVDLFIQEVKREYGPETRPKFETKSVNTRGMVIHGAHILSPFEKLALLTVASDLGWNIIFLVPGIDPHDLELTKEEGTSLVTDAKPQGNDPLRYGDIRYLTVGTQVLHELYQSLSFQTHKNAYRALKLAFGPVFSMGEFKDYHEDTSLDRVIASLGRKTDFQLREDLLRAFIGTIAKLSVHDTDLDYMIKSHWKPALEVRQLVVNLAIGIFLKATRDNNEQLDLADDISFMQFVQDVPACNFLSQHQRICLWLDSVIGVGNPLEKIVPGGTFPPPIPPLLVGNIHSEHFLLAFGVPEYGTAPSYRPQPKDDLISEREGLLFQCSQGDELDWNQISRNPQFPFSLDTLMSLLLVSPYVLKILTAINAKYLYELFRRSDNKRFGPSLRRVLHALNDPLVQKLVGPHLEEHFAVAQWALASFENVNVGPPLQPSDSAMSVLLGLGVPFEKYSPKLGPVLKILSAPLDFFANQPSLWRGLAMDKTVFAGDISLGAAVLQQVLEDRDKGNFLSGKLSTLLQFVKDPTALIGGDHPDPTSYPLEFLSARLEGLEQLQLELKILGPSAWALLIATVSEATQVWCLLHSFALHVESLGEVQGNAFLLEVLAGLGQPHFANSTSRLQFLDGLFYCRALPEKSESPTPSTAICLRREMSKSEIAVFVSNASKLDPAWQLCLKTLYNKSLEPFLMQVGSGGGKATQQVLVELMPQLLCTTLSNLDDSNFGFPSSPAVLRDLIAKAVQLFSPAGFDTLKQQTLGTPRHLVLQTLAWAMAPYVDLDITADDSHPALVQSIAQHPAVGFRQRVLNNLQVCSTLALFLVKPSVLRLSTLKSYLRVFKQSIEEETFLVTQRGKEPLPPCTLQVHRRLLPLEDLQPLEATLVGLDLSTIPIIQEPMILLTSSCCHLDVASGVHAESLKRNLRSLYLTQFIEANDQLRPTRFALQHILWAWFLGFTEDAEWVFKWMNMSPPTEEQRAALLPSGAKPEDYKAYCVVPLPSCLDLRLVLPSSLKLFGASKDEASFTLQQLDAIMPGFPKPAVTEMIKGDNNPRQKAYTDLAQSVPRLLAEEVARTLVKQLSPLNQVRLTDAANETGGGSPISTQNYTEIAKKCRPLMEVLALGIQGLIGRDEIIRLEKGEQSTEENSPERWVVTLIRCFLSKIKEKLQKEIPDPAERALATGVLHHALVDNIGYSAVHLNVILHTLLFSEFEIAGVQVSRAIWSVVRAFGGVVNVDKQIRKHDHTWDRAVPYVSHTTATMRDLSLPSLRDIRPFSPPNSGPPSALLKKQEKSFRGLESSIADAGQSRGSVLFKEISSMNLGVKNTRGSNPGLGLGPLSSATALFGGAPIDCNNLLKLEIHSGYAALTVSSGLTTLLLRKSVHGVSFLEFQAANSESTNLSSEDERLDGVELVTAFPTHQVAWDYLFQLPKGTVAYMQGVVMVKGSSNWELFFPRAWFQVLPPAAATQKIPFWVFLESSITLGIRLPPLVKEIFSMMTKVLISRLKGLPISEKLKVRDFGQLGVPAAPSLFHENHGAEEAEDDEPAEESDDDILFLWNQINNSQRRAVILSITSELTDFVRRLIEERFNIQNLTERISNSSFKEFLSFCPRPFSDESVDVNLSLAEVLTQLHNNDVKVGAVNALNGIIPPLDLFFTPEFLQNSKKIEESIMPTNLAASKVFDSLERPNTKKPLGGMIPIGVFGFPVQPSLRAMWIPKKLQADIESSSTSKAIAYLLEWSILDPVFAAGEEVAPSPSPPRTPGEDGDGNETDSEDGMSLLFSEQPPDGDQTLSSAYQSRLEGWIMNMLRSTLAVKVKERILESLSGSSAVQLHLNRELSEHVKIFSLIQSYPSVTTQGISKLIRGFRVEANLTPKQREFCRRQDNLFGIHFVPISQTQPYNVRLLQCGLKVEVLSFVNITNTFLLKDVEIYSSILKCLREGNCIVYIKGLNQLSDTLLKWCGEMTKRNPWVFVYFEGVDTHMNLVENLDRVIFHDADVGPVEVMTEEDSEEFAVPTPPDFTKPLHGTTAPSTWLAEWRATIDTRLLAQQFVFLVGAPGIGKTHYVNAKKEEWARRGEICKEHDGSSDEFFKQALADILDEHLNELVDANVWYLVMDEFHMMPVDLKRQLLQWVRSHPSVKLLMIGNRYDSVDMQLFREVFDVANPHSHLVCVRNDLVTFLRVKGSQIENDSNLALFASIWLRATRNLFGEELLSFRLFDKISDGYDNLEAGRLDYAVRILAKTLKQKIPHNPLSFAKEIVAEILEAYKQARYSSGSIDAPHPSAVWQDAFNRVFRHAISIPVTLSRDTPGISPWKLLVAAALCDRDGTCSSFPEFCHPERNYIPSSFSHPLHKLLSWISYMYAREQHVFPMQLGVRILATQGIVDFPLRFPVFPLGYASHPHKDSSWRIACAQVDVGNLEVVIRVVTRGYMIRHSEARRRWQKESITDVENFSKLVSIYPDFVNLTSDDNLHALLKLGDSTFVASVLAQTRARADFNDPSSPHFHAAWRLYRQLSFDDPTKVTLPNQGSTLGVVLHGNTTVEFDLKNLLLWAAKYAYAALEVQGKVSTFEDNLWSHLLHVSTLCEKEPDNLRRLWFFVFAPLVRSLGKDGLPYRQAIVLARSRYPPIPSWPKELQILSKLLRDRATLVDLETISTCTDILTEDSAEGMSGCFGYLLSFSSRFFSCLLINSD